jgi:hypothetical protein
MASEVGVLDIDRPPSCARAACSRAACSCRHRGQGRIIERRRDQGRAGRRAPLQEWLDAGLVDLDDLPGREHTCRTPTRRARVSRTFGYTTRSRRSSSRPMARTGAEAIGSMGTDTPIAVLSTGPRLLFDYFRSCSPRSPTRRSTPSARSWSPPRLHHRPRGQPARPRTPESCRQIELPPDPRQRRAGQAPPHQRGRETPASARRHAGQRPVPGGRRRRPGACARRHPRRGRPRPSPTGANIIILLRPRLDADDLAPIPSLLLTAAVHHHLVREKTRTKVGLVVEAGDAREVHHMALLSATAPPPSTRTWPSRPSRHDRPGALTTDVDPSSRRSRNYIKACRQGRAEGDVQDGHLHGRLLHRRPDLRGDRPRPGARRRVLHRHAVQARRHRPRRDRRRGGRRATPRPTRSTGGRPTASSRWAASTSGAARASTTCSTPRRSSSCSTPPAPALRHLQGVHQARRRPGRAPHATLRGLFRSTRPPAGPARRGRAGQRDRQALLHRRDELRLDLAPRPTRRWPSP